MTIPDKDLVDLACNIFVYMVLQPTKGEVAEGLAVTGGLMARDTIAGFDVRTELGAGMFDNKQVMVYAITIDRQLALVVRTDTEKSEGRYRHVMENHTNLFDMKEKLIAIKLAI